MAAQQIRIQDLTTRIATECKSIRTILNGNVADLSTLTTTAKGNLVAALNELKTTIDTVAASGGATINDASVASTTQTYSVTKILAVMAATSDALETAIADQAVATKSEILGGAGAAFDTLQELKALLDGEGAEIATLTAAVGNRVRHDVNTQGLTVQQKQNARTNIDAFGSAEIGDPDTDFVATFEAGL